VDRKTRLYTTLAAVFISALILAEITGSKLIQWQVTASLVFTMTMGVIPFPITFIVTDIVNEYYGRKGIRFITFLGMAMIGMVLLILQIDMRIPAAAISPVKDEAFNAVFSASARIMVGSLLAYLIGQLVDIYVFHAIRERTGERYLWLRATGSTFVSQFIDSFVVLFVAFYGQLTTEQIIGVGVTNYLYKFAIAVLITPALYLVHRLIDGYLGKDVAHAMMETAHARGGVLNGRQGKEG